MIKILEENIHKNCSVINSTNIFFRSSPMRIEIKAKINQWNIIILRSFCPAKETIDKTKTDYGLGENICKQCNSQGLNFQNIQTVHTTQ